MQWSQPELNVMEAVVKVLQDRFGTLNTRERFRCELRMHKRREGEELQSLYQYVKRLVSLAYPNEKSEATSIMARDAFLEALDDPNKNACWNENRLRLRKRSEQPHV